jgi:type II secretory ATPase GspE/PulE/Tfp pilus assembly ATPase PilB-like protein
VITEAGLKEALVHQRTKGVRLGEALIALGHADEATVWRAVAKLHGLPFVDLAKGKVSERLLGLVPAEFAREQGLLPLLEKDGRLVVAVDDQHKRILADQLEFMIGQPVSCALAAPSALRAALLRYYGAGAEASVAARMGAESEDEGDAPIIRLVTRMFADALALRASDIHLEPMERALRVRYRVDGLLRTVAEHPPHLAAPLISRLKIMGSMDIAEKRKPQDGRIAVTLEGREIDVRASILPSNHGETMVLRLLDKSASLIGLKELGFEREDHAWFQRLIKHPHGIVLVTGPTGSGKTTTLYAALAALNKPDVKIITAEDPVEYHLAGINQVQVAPKIGLTFARILRSMLRAAPNIILVGEIRDLETAEVAIQAALTGHLVFSTLHTNDAPSALTRLIDMGVQPFLVATAIQGVLAQRLVRRLCPECAEEYAPEDSELRLLGLDPADHGQRALRRARGCRACDGAGYRGRLGLFELFEMDAELRDQTFQALSLESIRAAALASGKLRPLLMDGARKVLEGRTSVTEVLRVCRAAGQDDSEVKP